MFISNIWPLVEFFSKSRRSRRFGTSIKQEGPITIKEFSQFSHNFKYDNSTEQMTSEDLSDNSVINLTCAPGFTVGLRNN